MQSTSQKQLQLQETILKIGNKLLKQKSINFMPKTGPDMDILIEALNPRNIEHLNLRKDEKDYVNIITFRMNEVRKTLNEFLKLDEQMTIYNKPVNSILDYLSKTRIIFIDPSSELYRINRTRTAGFKNLHNAPQYFKDYFEILRKAEKNNLDDVHLDFWRKLTSKQGTKTQKITHFISWNFDIQESIVGKLFKPDLLIPPVPYLYGKHKQELLQIAETVNNISYQLKEEKSAFYLVLSADVFKDEQLVKQISEMIHACKNKVIILKILDRMKFGQEGFGHYAKKNLEYLLKVIKDIKLDNPDRIVGLLNGGGFGYSLLSVFDFFTETVGNYRQDSFAKGTGKYRGLVHPISLAVEPFEGVQQNLYKHGKLIVDCPLGKKYEEGNTEIMDVSSKTQWSRDCRSMGINMWNKRVNALHRTIKNGKGNRIFDEISNSDFSYLAPIVKNVLNNF